METLPPDSRRRRFLWGVCLAWIPFLFLAVPTAIGLFAAFRGIAQEKATGLAAVAGGLVEFFATFGLATTVVLEIAAIIFLLRAIHGGRPARTFIAAVSLCCSGFMLAIVGIFFWLRGLSVQ